MAFCAVESHSRAFRIQMKKKKLTGGPPNYIDAMEINLYVSRQFDHEINRSLQIQTNIEVSIFQQSMMFYKRCKDSLKNILPERL